MINAKTAIRRWGRHGQKRSEQSVIQQVMYLLYTQHIIAASIYVSQNSQ